MSDNRRSDERITTNLQAKWSGETGEHDGRIEDLSLGGCFVNTTARVDEREIVVLEIELGAGKWLELRGEVTSSQIGVGFGLLFPFLTEDEEEALREFLSSQ
jgi:hypothetical protein